MTSHASIGSLASGEEQALTTAKRRKNYSLLSQWQRPHASAGIPYQVDLDCAAKLESARYPGGGGPEGNGALKEQG